jgi:autophagy-related protein 2
MIRIQIRTPSASASMRRSGALVLDLHDVALCMGSTNEQKPATRFADAEMPLPSSTIISAECRRILIACSSAGVGRATSFLSLGPIDPVGEAATHMHDGANTSQNLSTSVLPMIKPRITLTRANRASRPTSGTLALIVNLPSAHILLSKTILDDIQYWADDVAKLIEHTSNSGDMDTERAESRDTSLIGSRFFARSRRSDSDGGSTLGGGRVSRPTETVIKVAISEGNPSNLQPSSRC